MELIYIFYKISDNPQNVCAPGTLHATSKRVNLNHVFFFIKKLKGMASVLEDNEFLSKLISGDVASNELYYHKSCYKTFLSRYQQQISKKLNSNKEMRKNKENLVKAMRLSQIVNQVYDQEQYESVSSFEVFVLEKSYLHLLSNNNIIQTSHISRFYDFPLDSIPDVEKRTINNKLFIIFFR